MSIGNHSEGSAPQVVAKPVTFWQYRGRCSRGHVEVGNTSVAPEVFIAEKFGARWRTLAVRTAEGRIVGEINRYVDGNRTWWAES